MIPRISIGAFAKTKETVDALNGLKEDPLLMRSSIAIHEGGMKDAINLLASYETPALLIVETDAEGDALYGELGGLADVCAPETRLILIGVQNDIALFKDLLSQGVSQYFVGPVTAEELRNSIAEIFKEDESKKGARVIAFYGTAGGVGSSVLANNTAYMLSEVFNDDVIVVDLDIPYGTAALTFNLQPQQTVADALTQTNRLDEVLIERFLEEFNKNVSLLASPAALGTGVNVTSESLNTVLKFVKNMAEYVILDIPHLWQSWVNDVFSSVEEVVLVTVPDLSNLRDAKSLLEFVNPSRGVDMPTRLVFNRVGESKKTELSARDFKEVINMGPVVSVPYDSVLFGTALNNGEMLAKVNAKSKVTEAVRKLAHVVSAKTGIAAKEEKTLFFKPKK